MPSNYLSKGYSPKHLDLMAKLWCGSAPGLTCRMEPGFYTRAALKSNLEKWNGLKVKVSVHIDE